MTDRTTGTLYVVGTPIGNLDDLTARAITTLGRVATCYAEDTRRTGTLLSRAGVTVGTRSLHAHNEERRLSELLARLEGGEDLALVTDAGTPGVSDPGRRVVAAVLAAGLEVSPLPGASAVSTALSASGMAADRYLFLGFAPRKGRAREEWLSDIEQSPHTVVVFEAPTRLGELFATLHHRGMSRRRAVVCRELTKLHEEIRQGAIDELATVYADATVKGEVTIVVEGAEARTAGPDPEELRRAVRELRADGAGKREVATHLRERFGVKRNEAYRMSLDGLDTKDDA